MAKIHINLQQGVIDIEGDEVFVREAFADVRSSLSAMQTKVLPPQAAESPAPSIEGETVPPKQAPSKGKPIKTGGPKAQGDINGTSKYYKGTLKAQLDLSSLEAFVDAYSPLNNRERILVYVAFLRDTVSIYPCDADDIYSCFFEQKQKYKIPEAFGKNLNDARAEGYIAYDAFNSISIPTVGENALLKMLKKKAT